MTTATEVVRELVPIREGLLAGDLSRLDEIRLAGCRCTSCGETALGIRSLCPNCGRDTVANLALSDRGSLWSYTVVRHKPPGAYKGPNPFMPFGLGLVELPGGLRVLSPIRCDIEKLKVGLSLRFRPYVRHDVERDVVAFDFEAFEEECAHV